MVAIVEGVVSSDFATTTCVVEDKGVGA